MLERQIQSHVILVLDLESVDLVEADSADSADSADFVLMATGAEAPLMPALLAAHWVAHLSRAQELGKYSSLADRKASFYAFVGKKMHETHIIHKVCKHIQFNK